MTRKPVLSSLRLTLALATTALTPEAAALLAANCAQGAVSGFGSVTFGGLRHDDSKAAVVDADDNLLPATKGVDVYGLLSSDRKKPEGSRIGFK